MGERRVEYRVIFLNNGDVIFQAGDYAHCYSIAEDAAKAVHAYIQTGSTEEWDGNDPDAKMTYSREAERLGHYTWHNADDVWEHTQAIWTGTWDNLAKFYQTLQYLSRE